MRDEMRDRLLKDLHLFQIHLKNQQLEMFNRLSQHLQYHVDNEVKWGLVKLMKQHPFKTFGAGVVLGISIFHSLELDQILKLIITKLF